MINSMIEQVTALQGAVHQAAWGVVEVETRERGYRIENAREAEAKYKQAVDAYKTAFGVGHEWEDKYMPGLHGTMPLNKPTQRRLIELCGSEVL